ncbi:MAG: DNA alkylation repair protein, partial [Acidimicrobiales bacterium]
VNGLAERVVLTDVEPMSAYMRHQFPFLGVKAPGQKAATRVAVAAAGWPADEEDVIAAIDACWARPEREYRYAGCHLATRFARLATPDFINHTARWITGDAWWDTCDPLARGSVGQVVRRHPQRRSTMDQWLAGDNLWLIRAAIIHMGGWGDAIDRDWVTASCLARAGHQDFFIRKAIGWILRDLARVDPDTVIGFVEGPGAPVLSNLSKREALKNVARPVACR